MSSADIDKIDFSAIHALPTPSAVLHRISSVISSSDSSAKDIVDALKLDPAIASKVLKLANSAYVGIPRTVSSLQNAVVILGVKRIFSLVISSEVLAACKGKKLQNFDMVAFWRHSITTAYAAESLARHLQRYDSTDVDEVFSSALLHDIGKLLLAAYAPSVLENALEKSCEKSIPYHLAEEAELSHTQVGSKLAEQWNFPPDLRCSVSKHHCLDLGGTHERLVAIVHVADVMTHILGYGMYPNETSPEVDEQALNIVQLPLERLRIIAESALQNEERVESLMHMLNV